MVAVPQVQIPNFVGTLGQVEQVQQSRLQAMAARQAMEEAQQFNAALPSLTPALMAGEGPEYDAAVARLGGMGARGLQVALPLMQDARLRREFNAWQQGGGGPAPAAPTMQAGGGDPMQRIAAVESGGNDAARNPRSSAAGRFQIIDSTWRQYAPRLGLTDAQRMDPAAQEQVARAIQADARQAIGRDLSPGEAYGAHFLGVGGLRAFANAPRDADAQQVYAQAAGPQVAAQAFRANPGLLEPGMTVGQVMDALGRRMGGGGQPAATPASAPGNRTGIDPAELRRIEMGLASPNPMIQRAAQARLQALQLQQRDPTDSYREETRNIGGRQVAGQVNARTGQFTAYPGQTGAERPDEITPARAVATVRRLGPMLAAGQIAPGSPEFDDYAIAYQVATRPTQVWVDDPSNPGTQRQVSQPGLVLDPTRFPRPPGEYNAPGGAIPVAAGAPAPASPAPGDGNVTPAAAAGGVATPAAGGDVTPVDPSRTRTDPAVQATAGDRSRLRSMEVEAQGILDALQAFRQERNRAGILDRGITAAGIPTPLATAWTNAALLAKGEALFNLGVLNGPDLQIIQRALSDPSTVRGFFTSDAVAERQIAQIENLIRQRLDSARRQFNAPLPAQPSPGQPRPAGIQADPPDPAPRRAAPQIGTVEDGFRFRGGDPSSPSNWERVR
jgi:hypothetical protein